jgi:mannan endo-1,4-beta-mannosidase
VKAGKIGKAVAVTLPLALTACAAAAVLHPAAHRHRPAALSPGCARAALPFAGVILPPPQPSALRALTAKSGMHVGAEEFYATFGAPFLPGREDGAEKAGMLPVLQWNPLHSSVAAIAAGRYDAYLRSYARAVRAFDCPIVLSFGHEMNGSWYPWGFTHTPAAVFVAAWRRIVTVFRAEGASNAIWMWTANRYVPGAKRVTSPAAWWPGSGYVNWVGLDGYFYRPTDTFGSVFAPALAVIRALTPDPVVIAETGAWGTAQAARVANLFQGAVAAGVGGVIYFDLPGHEPWELSSPQSLAAYRHAAIAYLSQTSQQ